MKHIREQYEETLYTSALTDFYFSGLRVGVLDIETTGLNPSRNKFILGGLYDCQTKTLHQFFAQNRGEEAMALAGCLQALSRLDMVITYNGKHFDLPFLEKRLQTFADQLAYTAYDNPQMAAAASAEELRALSAKPLPYNLDLYLVLNGHSPVKKLVPNLKQKTVENYMGLWQTRADEISGAESVALYDAYEKNADPALEEKILLHNSDDVLQLTRLTKIIAKTDFHKAMFHLGFPVKSLTIKKIQIQRDALVISGSQNRSPIDYMGFSFHDLPVEISLTRKDASFRIEFPVIRNSGAVIIDLDAAGLSRKEFQRYPTCDSGFLVLEEPVLQEQELRSISDRSGRHYMEINHFIRAFLELFLESIQ